MCRVARDRRTDHKQSGEVCRRTLGLGMSTGQASVDGPQQPAEAAHTGKQPPKTAGCPTGDTQMLLRVCLRQRRPPPQTVCAPAIPLHELRAAMRHALRDCVQFCAHCQANNRPGDCQAIKRNGQGPTRQPTTGRWQLQRSHTDKQQVPGRPCNNITAQEECVTQLKLELQLTNTLDLHYMPRPPADRAWRLASLSSRADDLNSDPVHARTAATTAPIHAHFHHQLCLQPPR